MQDQIDVKNDLGFTRNATLALSLYNHLLKVAAEEYEKKQKEP